MAIFVAVLGVLVAQYKSALVQDRDLVMPFWYLSWGAAVGVIIAAVTAGLAFAYLRGAGINPNFLSLLLAVLVIGTAAGTFLFSWNTVVRP